MCYLRNNDAEELFGEHGFTLIEVIVALAIITAVIIAVTPLITSSYSGIFTSGYRSKAQFSGQQDIENAIANPGSAADSNLVIPFSTPISVAGNYIAIDETFTDSNGTSRTVTLNVFVPNELTLGSQAPPSGEEGSYYSYAFTARGGTPPYSYTVTGGSKPDGLNLNEITGLLSGIPTEADSYKFYVTVTDNASATSGMEFTININE